MSCTTPKIFHAHHIFLMSLSERKQTAKPCRQTYQPPLEFPQSLEALPGPRCVCVWGREGGGGRREEIILQSNTCYDEEIILQRNTCYETPILLKRWTSTTSAPAASRHPNILSLCQSARKMNKDSCLETWWLKCHRFRHPVHSNGDAWSRYTFPQTIRKWVGMWRSKSAWPPIPLAGRNGSAVSVSWGSVGRADFCSTASALASRFQSKSACVRVRVYVRVCFFCCRG
jgi:hypothetical protein